MGKNNVKRFTYCVCYKYNPTNPNDLNNCFKKEPDEISEALRHFPLALPNYLVGDRSATCDVFDDPTKQYLNSINVVVATTLSKISTDKAVKKCLDGLGLLLCTETQV